MFDQPQLEALVLGARIVESWGDPSWRWRRPM